ncbi:hypothetical protein DFQ14_10463 [Halopolyspora algeriensis]|uniref:Uncharacterized protein n=1 Tax=Halopolyspora algeriensis TaxID=1500506 RepID=A0A368VY15_9ACTN|nr:hypothetical protein [Halopolyspora algeriensis]RCW44474.1 hypothetical protein DFQ14_10463 [Halopolyspora algeriensis]TQM55835.1 hypothetical protein FHU43_0611 [Halopolyspora algeriensis]
MTVHEASGRRKALLVFGWAWVGLPFAYGVYALIQKVTLLFAG